MKIIYFIFAALLIFTNCKKTDEDPTNNCFLNFSINDNTIFIDDEQASLFNVNGHFGLGGTYLVEASAFLGIKTYELTFTFTNKPASDILNIRTQVSIIIKEIGGGSIFTYEPVSNCVLNINYTKDCKMILEFYQILFNDYGYNLSKRFSAKIIL